MGCDVGASAFLKAEVVLLLKLLHLHFPCLIFGVNLLLDFALATLPLVFPTLKKDVVAEEFVSRVELSLIAVEPAQQISVSDHVKFLLGFTLGPCKHFLGFQLLEVFGNIIVT